VWLLLKLSQQLVAQLVFSLLCRACSANGSGLCPKARRLHEAVAVGSDLARGHRRRAVVTIPSDNGTPVARPVRKAHGSRGDGRVTEEGRAGASRAGKP
jgi:hypothetical protein